MEDTWFSRDLPVLDAIVREIDNTLFSGTYPQLSDIAGITGLEILHVGSAALALDNAGLIELHQTMTGGNPGPWSVMGVAGNARQLVGAWPTPESLARDLYQQIENLSASEANPTKSSWFKNFLGGTSAIGKDVVVEVLATAIGKTIYK